MSRVEPIRIVPLHSGAVAPAPAPAPQLTYRGGPLLTAVEVFTIFWGSNDSAADLNAFFDFVLTSELIDQLAEYNTNGMAIGHGRRIGTTTIQAPPSAAVVSDADVQQTLESWIGDGQVPAPSANTLYFVYLPSGVAVDLGGSQSCQAFCGYHNDIDGRVFYAVMPYPGCAGCVGSLAEFDALTSTSSHELCEAITDPIPGQGWYDDANGEIGDICAWQTKSLGGYTVQLEWSNVASACV